METPLCLLFLWSIYDLKNKKSKTKQKTSNKNFVEVHPIKNLTRFGYNWHGGFREEN